MMAASTLFLLTSILVLMAAANEEKVHHLRAHHTNEARTIDKAAEAAVICRIVSTTTSYQGVGSNEINRHEETTSCIPIIDGKQSDQDHHVSLPSTIYERHMNDIRQGTLLVEITGAKLDEGNLHLVESSDFKVIEDPKHPMRRNLIDHGFTIGHKTIAIVRISTRDARPPQTLNQMEAAYLNNPTSVRSQFRACSFEKVDFTLAENGAHDVFVDDSVRNYNSASDLRNVANKQLTDQLGVGAMYEIADRVVYCMPPNNSWQLAAVSSINDFKVMMGSEFCTSLSGLMHELGHTMGLLHSNQGGEEYGDLTGYMGYGQPEDDGPIKCFNGQKHHQLGWFDDKVFDWDSSMEPQKISLAAFVDYDLTAANQYVIVNIDNTLFLQYNRASKFNRGTQEYENQVTIVEKLPEGSTPAGSNLLGGIRDGGNVIQREFRIRDYRNGQALILEICDRVDAANAMSDANVMTISMGLGRSICSGDGATVAEDDDACTGVFGLRGFLCRRFGK